MDTNSKRLRYLIDLWSQENGRKASVGELLRVCKKAGVPLPLIKEEHSKSRFSKHVTVTGLASMDFAS